MNANLDQQFAPLQFYFKKNDIMALESEVLPGEIITGYLTTHGVDPTTGKNVAIVQALFKDASGTGRSSSPKLGCPYPPECLSAEGYINPNFILTSFSLNLQRE